MNALILVDIQNDFVPGGALAVSGGDEIIQLANSIQQSFTMVVATQDWHPKDHKSFASSHAGKKPFEKIMLHDLEQTLWPDHCVQGSRGAEFHPDLQMNRVEAVIRKGMDKEIDSYSGFFDNGHKRSTGLAGYLREKRVERIFLCGLASDYCVAFTARDGLRENFKVYIIEDATRAIDAGGYEKAKSELLGAGGQFILSKELHRYL